MQPISYDTVMKIYRDLLNVPTFSWHPAYSALCFVQDGNLTQSNGMRCYSSNSLDSLSAVNFSPKNRSRDQSTNASPTPNVE
jgi:hypothetical protein